MTRLTARLGVLLVLLLGAAACGGAAADDTLSAEDYRDAGNAVCRSIDAEISDILSGGTPTVEAVHDELAGRMAVALQTLRDGLAELRPPTDLAADHDELLTAIDDAVATLEEATADEAVAARLIEEGPPLDEIDVLAHELGLAACTAEGSEA